MAKVFRLHTNGGSLEDWSSTSAYGNAVIQNIQDPDGSAAKRQITSIPSPFARLDLVKTAFKFVSDIGLEGKTIYHRMVSDSFDLGEMLFNQDSLGDKLKILTWDPQTDLENLRKSTNTQHRLYGDTLKLFLDQDREAYNFDLMRRMYMVEYDHKIIGGTSPCTLFFTTANDLSKIDLHFGKDRLFDDEYAPLCKRDPEYQKYLFWLFAQYPVLISRMGEVFAYLEKTLHYLDANNHALYEQIQYIRKAPAPLISQFDTLNTGMDGDPVEVLHFPLGKRKVADAMLPAQNSEFVIDSSKYSGNKPLVLQDRFGLPLRYLTENWNPHTQVPPVDTRPLEERTLPGQVIKYPYLTISDFLEPHLIRTVYPIDKTRFFDGNLEFPVGEKHRGFLLPIKPLFFSFFNSGDLQKRHLDGKPWIELKQMAGDAVQVRLRVPIAKPGEYITFERIYYNGSGTEIPTINEAGNKGTILENQFGVTVFPFVQHAQEHLKASYRVHLVDRDAFGLFAGNQYSLNFFSNSSPTQLAAKAKRKRSDKNTNQRVSSDFYVLDQDFDYIQVRHTYASGMVLPKWPAQVAGTQKFTFAVDFGTTNTHIEYRKGENPPEPFAINAEDVQYATLFDPIATTEDFGGTNAFELQALVLHELFPKIIDKKDKYFFPQRTVLSESNTLNLAKTTYSLADFNIPFTFQKERWRDDVTINTNLKWGVADLNHERRVKAFLHSLALFMRAKVLLNGGSLADTRLVWFYPASMSTHMQGTLSDTWTEIWGAYFGPAETIKKLPESLAPFYYFRSLGKLPGGGAVSIDIGGGTTDVVVFEAEKPVVFTSFRFAGNALFGDGFTEFGAGSHGLIRKYAGVFKSYLADNKHRSLVQVLEQLENRKRSEEINNFLFSLETNQETRDNENLRYSHKLSRDASFKPILVYFYTALIYHVAMLMKNKGCKMPRTVVFSGTASKILTIIGTDVILTKFTRLIFERIYDEAYDSDGVSIVRERLLPKEVTSKGGLMASDEDFTPNISLINSIFTTLPEVDLNNEKLHYSDIEVSLVRKKLVEQILFFHEFFLNLNSKNLFVDLFGISLETMAKIKEEIGKDLENNLIDGIKFYRKIDNVKKDESELNETTFFYPIIGRIRHLLGSLS